MNASIREEPPTEDPFAGQPGAIVERDGVRYTLLGTAHISKASVEAVQRLAADPRFDAIAVELDPHRLRSLTEPDALRELDLFRILREGKTGMVAANLALAAYQRRLSEQLGIEPGAELKAAALAARDRGLPLQVIDRDVGTTLRRAWRALGFWGRMKLVSGLGVGLFEREDVDAESIEKLKQGDMLESSFGEFAAQSPPIYQALIAERDRYMAARLREANAPGPDGRDESSACNASFESHVRGEPAGITNPVRGELAGVAKPVRGELAGVTKPVRGEPAGVTNAVRGEPAEITNPVRGEPAEITNPVRGEPAEITNPVRGEPVEPRFSPDPARPSTGSARTGMGDFAQCEPDGITNPVLGEPVEPRQVLVVIGAGHLNGLASHLREDRQATDAVRTELEAVPSGRKVPWVSLLIAVLVLGSFAWGYWHGGAHLGSTLVITWFVATAIGGALGCIAAGGHPLSVLAGGLWSPFKPFHPGIASGTVSALVEAWVRKPTYQDFLNLRDDVATLKGWYRNRVSRTFLNFFLTCMGTIAGEVFALARIAGKLG